MTKKGRIEDLVSGEDLEKCPSNQAVAYTLMDAVAGCHSMGVLAHTTWMGVATEVEAEEGQLLVAVAVVVESMGEPWWRRRRRQLRQPQQQASCNSDDVRSSYHRKVADEEVDKVFVVVVAVVQAVKNDEHTGCQMTFYFG